MTKEINFKKKYLHKQTNEICELVGTYENSGFLRPLNYNGLMSYNVIFSSPNWETDWEVVDEDNYWNYKQALNDILEKTASGFYSEVESTMKLFEAKNKCRDLIIKDLKEHMFTLPTTTKECERIINKRFGDLE